MITGILNVYKEAGFTSHDAVAKLRGILRQKKIGHTGTLDPAAEGVLPVCLGQATKLCDMLTDEDKSYRTVLLLGVETDTQDTTGKIVRTAPAAADEDAVREAVLSFVGGYDQIPPMYSARRVNGKKLYELARAGLEVERRPSRVEIFSIEIEEIALPEVTMTVRCSKGTYIRTLCHDIGARLGCGGCMKQLVRTRVGGFRVEESLRLDEIADMVREAGGPDGLGAHLHSIPSMFPGLPGVRTKEQADRLLHNGNPLSAEDFVFAEGAAAPAPERVLVFDSAGDFCGLYRMNGGAGRYKPEKMFLGG